MKYFLSFFLNLTLPFSVYSQDLGTELSMAVKEIVQNSQCASCHTENRLTTKPAALRVFNLSKDNWSQGMSMAQMERLTWSLTGASPEEIREMAGEDVDIRPLKEHEKAILNRFMAFEREKRRNNPLYEILNF